MTLLDWIKSIYNTDLYSYYGDQSVYSPSGHSLDNVIPSDIIEDGRVYSYDASEPPDI